MISRIGLGLAALGRPSYINVGHGDDLGHTFEKKVLMEKVHQVLDIAWKLGIRYFDTARSYGDAEFFLAEWAKKRGIDPEEIDCGSKWGYIYTANWEKNAVTHEIKKHSVENFENQWTESHSILGDYLKLYQIHSATLESRVLENTAVLNSLMKLKEKGIKIGFSTSGPEQSLAIMKAIQIEIDKAPLFDAVQCTYNMLEVSAGLSLMEAYNLGLMVIIKEALANGILTDKIRTLENIPSKDLLLQKCDELDCSLDTIAFAFVLSQPWADIVLSGASTPVQLISNCDAIHYEGLNFEWAMNIAEKTDWYWSRRKNLAWN